MKHTRPPCPSPTPRVHSNSRPLSWWCHPTISSSAILFSCLQSFPASGSFPTSQLFTSGGQSTGVWALASFLPIVTWVYVPRFFVSSQQRFGATDVKAPGCHSSRSWTNRVIALRQISVTALLYLEDSRRGRERERAHAHGRERVREKALWLLLLHVFSLHLGLPYANWA